MNMQLNSNRLMPFLIISSLLILQACSQPEKTDMRANPETPILVSVASPSGETSSGIQVSGQIEASQTANISTRVMGFITMLKVKEGDAVSKGQLLVSISNQDILAKRGQSDAQIAEAQAALNSAQKDKERFTILYNQQSATAKELDNVTLQYNAAKARLDGAKQMRNEVSAMLGYTQLTAPFSGIVTHKMAEAGSMANPGVPLLTIEQKGSYQVSATVPENTIQQIKPGVKGMVTIKAINKTFAGEVTQVNQSSQYTGGQYLIKVSIPDTEKNGLYAGMYANVSIEAKESSPVKTNAASVMVPVTSLIQKDQLTGLYTIGSNGTALLRWVRLGKTFGDQVEVLSGLSKDEKCIVQAEGNLYNGAPVKIK